MVYSYESLYLLGYKGGGVYSYEILYLLVLKGGGVCPVPIEAYGIGVGTSIPIEASRIRIGGSYIPIEASGIRIGT